MSADIRLCTHVATKKFGTNSDVGRHPTLYTCCNKKVRHKLRCRPTPNFVHVLQKKFGTTLWCRPTPNFVHVLQKKFGTILWCRPTSDFVHMLQKSSAQHVDVGRHPTLYTCCNKKVRHKTTFFGSGATCTLIKKICFYGGSNIRPLCTVALRRPLGKNVETHFGFKNGIFEYYTKRMPSRFAKKVLSRHPSVTLMSVGRQLCNMFCKKFGSAPEDI
jgi:hypothetical protein